MLGIIVTVGLFVVMFFICWYVGYNAMHTYRSKWKGAEETARTLSAQLMSQVRTSETLQRELRHIKESCPLTHCGHDVAVDAKFCRFCGYRMVQGDIPTFNVTWAEANKYLHDHAQWKRKLVYKDDSHIYLPWPKSKRASFSVSHVQYVWEQIEDEDSGEGSFWIQLTWMSPSQDEIVLVNKRSNRDHLLTVNPDDNDPITIKEGDLAKLKDIAFQQIVEEGLIALYFYLRDIYRDRPSCNYDGATVGPNEGGLETAEPVPAESLPGGTLHEGRGD